MKEDGSSKKEVERREQEWLKEKRYLEEQGDFVKKQLEESRRMHDSLMAAFHSIFVLFVALQYHHSLHLLYRESPEQRL